MIGLLTGGTGDGKTLYAITVLIHDAYKANRAANALVPDTEDAPCDDSDPAFQAAIAVNKKWQPLRDFRTNIKGVNIPGVTVLPLEKDWRQYRDGSICIYDESHQKGMFRTTGKPGLSDDDVITQLDEHRHRGFDIWFLTQFPTKIHHEIRQLVKRHVHLVRSHGMQRSMLYDWQKAVNNPEDNEAVIALAGEIWEFRTEGYAWYKSTSMNTHKATMPKALKRALIGLPIILLLLGGIAWGIAWATADDRGVGQEAKSGGKATASAGATPAGSGEELKGSPIPPGQEWTVAPALPKFKGCAALSAVCRCWNGAGQQIDLTQDQCHELIAKPLPVDFSDQSQQVQRQEIAQAPESSSMDFVGAGVSSVSSAVGGVPRVGDNKLPIIGAGP